MRWKSGRDKKGGLSSEFKNSSGVSTSELIVLAIVLKTAWFESSESTHGELREKIGREEVWNCNTRIVNLKIRWKRKGTFERFTFWRRLKKWLFVERKIYNLWLSYCLLICILAGWLLELYMKHGAICRLTLYSIRLAVWIVQVTITLWDQCQRVAVLKTVQMWCGCRCRLCELSSALGLVIYFFSFL